MFEWCSKCQDIEAIILGETIHKKNERYIKTVTRVCLTCHTTLSSREVTTPHVTVYR